MLRLTFIILALLFSNFGLAQDVATIVPMKEKGTATFYVDASAGNQQFDLLVDTGAGYTALNKDLIHHLLRSGHAIRTGEVEGILANGDICVLPVYKVKELTLGGCIIRDIDVAETPSNTRNLLGLNALKKAAPFTFSLEPAVLSLSNCTSVVASID